MEETSLYSLHATKHQPTVQLDLNLQVLHLVFQLSEQYYSFPFLLLFRFHLLLFHFSPTLFLTTQ